MGEIGNLVCTKEGVQLLDKGFNQSDVFAFLWSGFGSELRLAERFPIHQGGQKRSVAKRVIDR
jgi:hypothetical protein